MPRDRKNFLTKTWDWFETALALRVTESERIRSTDPLNFYEEDLSNRKPLRVATALSVVLHVILFLMIFPSFGNADMDLTREVVVLRNLAPPAALAGGSSQPQAAPPQPTPVVPKPKAPLVPIPDPTPNDPEPIRKQEIIEHVPPVIQEIAENLNIGDITAPPGPPSQGGQGRSRAESTGTGPVQGPGPAAGGGRGPYMYGDGITNPQLLVKTTPSYTDEAIKAKVQGYVVLQAIIRRDGRVTDFKVLRGLGYGLEEKAIEEIANSWKFRPGMKDGQPVDVQATIEVQFTLR